MVPLWFCRCSEIMSPHNCNEILSPSKDGDDKSERVPTSAGNYRRKNATHRANASHDGPIMYVEACQTKTNTNVNRCNLANGSFPMKKQRLVAVRKYSLGHITLHSEPEQKPIGTLLVDTVTVTGAGYPLAGSPEFRLGTLEPHHLRQRCPDAPGWQHLDYCRVVAIRPEQRQENVRKPADLICRP